MKFFVTGNCILCIYLLMLNTYNTHFVNDWNYLGLYA